MNEPQSDFLRDFVARGYLHQCTDLEGLDDETIAWRLTDLLVGRAQEVFLPVWEATRGDDGYVSFELDPLLEDPDSAPPPEERTRR